MYHVIPLKCLENPTPGQWAFYYSIKFIQCYLNSEFLAPRTLCEWCPMHIWMGVSQPNVSPAPHLLRDPNALKSFTWLNHSTGSGIQNKKDREALVFEYGDPSELFARPLCELSPGNWFWANQKDWRCQVSSKFSKLTAATITMGLFLLWTKSWRNRNDPSWRSYWSQELENKAYYAVLNSIMFLDSSGGDDHGLSCVKDRRYSTDLPEL